MQHGGKPIKWLGDGVMFYFDRPAPACAPRWRWWTRLPAAGLPPAHVGLPCGPVLFQEGDYFGQTVNLSARIADYARPGEVLVTTRSPTPRRRTTSRSTRSARSS